MSKGKHEGLITLETFEKIQKRLTETAKVPARKDIHVDFPLRGLFSAMIANAPKPCAGQKAAWL